MGEPEGNSRAVTDERCMPVCGKTQSQRCASVPREIVEEVDNESRVLCPALLAHGSSPDLHRSEYGVCFRKARNDLRLRMPAVLLMKVEREGCVCGGVNQPAGSHRIR